MKKLNLSRLSKNIVGRIFNLYKKYFDWSYNKKEHNSMSEMHDSGRILKSICQSQKRLFVKKNQTMQEMKCRIYWDLKSPICLFYFFMHLNEYHYLHRCRQKKQQTFAAIYFVETDLHLGPLFIRAYLVQSFVRCGGQVVYKNCFHMSCSLTEVVDNKSVQ